MKAKRNSVLEIFFCTKVPGNDLDTGELALGCLTEMSYYNFKLLS